jgi:hypothetical protein
MLKVNFKDFIPEKISETRGFNATPVYEDLDVLMEKVNVFLSESENIAETIPFPSDFNLISVETIKVSIKFNEEKVSAFRVFFSENKEVTSYRNHLLASEER